jgi:amino acid permease
MAENQTHGGEDPKEEKISKTEIENIIPQEPNDNISKLQGTITTISNGQSQGSNQTPSTVKTDVNSEKKDKKKLKKATVMNSALMITNICLGTTIFTFAVRAKSFGMVWLLVSCLLVAAINYWSITRCVIASSRCEHDDFSEITEHFMGRRSRIILNIFLIVYSYATLMCFIGLIYPLFGRFIQSAFYRKKYTDFNEFDDDKWGKIYIKVPFFVALALIIALMCLIKDINKLNFTSYIGVAACAYALIVVMVECHSYYQHYKKTVYKEEDDSTHVNWINLGDAFTKKLDFFKGITNLIFAYACQSGIFPIFAGFKAYYPTEDSLKKMKLGTILGLLFTTILHIISIVCSFLTDPITPEDLIIYRKNKGTGKDVAMVIARLLVTISLIVTVPGYYFPLRLSIMNSFTKGELSNKFNILFTFISIFACAVVAALYDKILNYLSYIGFIAVFISFLFPALVYVYSTKKPLTYWKNLLEIILAVVICLIGLVAFVATLIDDIKG